MNTFMAAAAVLVLACFSTAHQVSAQGGPFSYRGFYEATLPNGANIVLFVGTDTCKFLYLDVANNVAATNLVDPDGNAPIDGLGNSTFTTIPESVGPVSVSFAASGATGTVGGQAFTANRSFLRNGSGSMEGSYCVANTSLFLSAGGKFYYLSGDDPKNYFGAVGSWSQGSLPPPVAIVSFQGQCVRPTNPPTIRTVAGHASLSQNMLRGEVIPIGGGDASNFVLTRDNLTHRLVNISTRGLVGSGANQLIAGFIIKDGAKRVLARAIAPSLGGEPHFVPGVLPNPKLELHSATGLIATNDDWQIGNDVVAIQATGLAPTNDFESALLVTLVDGPYTIVVSGVAGSTGVALVEVYEID